MMVHSDMTTVNILLVMNSFWQTCVSETGKKDGNVMENPPAKKVALCEGDMMYYETTNSCYWKVQKQSDFNQTLAECKKKGGSIVTIHSRPESQWIVEKLDTVYGIFWLGLTYSVTEKKFFWLNGKELKKDDYSRWSSDTPPTNDQTCVEVKGTEWATSPCERQLNGICFIQDVDMCLVRNGGCEQTCVTIGTYNRSCSCDTIYAAKGTRCLARCEVGNGGCQQMCKNTADHRTCSCMRGYDKTGIKCQRNFQTRLIGAMITGLIFGTLGICLCLLCVSWAMQGDDASLKGSSDKESIKKDSLDKSSIAKSSETMEDHGPDGDDEDVEAEVGGNDDVANKEKADIGIGSDI